MAHAQLEQLEQLEEQGKLEETLRYEILNGELRDPRAVADVSRAP